MRTCGNLNWVCPSEECCVREGGWCVLHTVVIMRTSLRRVFLVWLVSLVDWRQPDPTCPLSICRQQSSLSQTSFCSAKLIIIQSTASSNLSPLITGFNDLRFASFNTAGPATSSPQHTHNGCEKWENAHHLLHSTELCQDSRIFLLTSEIFHKNLRILSRQLQWDKNIIRTGALCINISAINDVSHNKP